MKVTKQSITKDAMTAEFFVADASPAFVNAVRRSIIDKVPTMAIEDVEFNMNNSVMFDEMLAHRLGLVSLKTDVDGYTFRENEEDGSPANQCTLTLEAEGPGLVTAGMMTSSDPKIVPAYADTVLTLLEEGQKISVVSKAILGKGQDHAKWSSGNAYYAYDADVKVKQTAELEEKKSLFPAGAFDSSGKVSAKAIKDNNLVDAVEGIAPDAITIDYDSGSFHFTVESWGQLPATEMVQRAVGNIQQELGALQEAIKQLK